MGEKFVNPKPRRKICGWGSGGCWVIQARETKKKPGKFHKARISFPIQSSNEHPLEGTSPTILLLKNDADDDDLQTKYLFTQH